jgi:enoyl-CoA hydratase/carnithine racemase
MTQGLVLRQDHASVVVLTLNRPEKLNALSPDLFLDLRMHLDAIDGAGGELRAVVVEGNGRSVCAGAEVEALNAGIVMDEPEFRSETIELLGSLRPVVIAAVHGHCYTGGLELALAADVIIAADDARFCDTHARLGIVPRWGMSARLPRRVGIACATRLSVTAEPVGPEEALRIGLCDYVVPRSELRSRAMALAERITGNVPSSVTAIRHLYDRALGVPTLEGLKYERAFSAIPNTGGRG